VNILKHSLGSSSGEIIDEPEAREIVLFMSSEALHDGAEHFSESRAEMNQIDSWFHRFQI
jgi:hypothetical protein